MKYPTNRRPQIGLWRSALIVTAVCALVINVATRYSDVSGIALHAEKTVAARALDAKRQHLLNDGLHWIAPTVSFEFQSAQVSPVHLPAVRAVIRFRPETWLYNRPPPSC